MISSVAQAIINKYEETPAGDALRAALTGELWFTEADWDDGKEVYPYAVFTWEGSTVDEIAGNRSNAVEIANMTFSIFSKNDDGGTEIFDLVSKFIELYDWATLTYPAGDYTHNEIQRTSTSNRGKIDNIWQIDLDYDVWFNHV